MMVERVSSFVAERLVKRMARQPGPLPWSLQHALDVELHARLHAHPDLEERMPHESVVDLAFFDEVLTHELVDEADVDELGRVRLRIVGVDAVPKWRRYMVHVAALLEPMTTREAFLIAKLVRRWDPSRRALAEIMHGTFVWARWAPNHNELVGRHLWLLAQRRIEMALGREDPFPLLP